MSLLAKNFSEAVQLANLVLSMSEDMPDGQAEDMRDIIDGYKEDFGKSVKDWPESARESFIEEINENITYWL